MTKNKNQHWKILSVICFLIGGVVWVPNIILGYGYSYWLLTFIVNPLGILFGYYGRSKFTILLNIVMTCSFFLFMFLGYLISTVFGGHP
ncbi:putative membrane protein [Evansella vedderi]|uniref:Membrane protein n=1 Tax=Evansella vedderi TaxID=38282 RepID=A0ABU0A2L4_9BACI|nr:hypothetical protein [Evansella vedderi]MDQ0257731.1 putative membrane protein [Evansella vedderi]